MSKEKVLHALGPPQGCSAAHLPSSSIARSPIEGGFGATEAKCVGYVAQAPLRRNRKAPPGTSPRSTLCLPPDARRWNRPPSKGAVLEPKWLLSLSLSLSLFLSPGLRGWKDTTAPKRQLGLRLLPRRTDFGDARGTKPLVYLRVKTTKQQHHGVGSPGASGTTARKKR